MIWILTLVGLTGFTLLLWIGVPQVAKLIAIKRLGNICREHGFLCLTYDDGPSEALTIKLLKVLEEKNAKATFYLLGEKIERDNIILGMIASSGHEVGTHSFQHLNAWTNLPQKVFNDLRRGIDTILGEGLELRLIRPPYGKINLLTLIYIWSKKLKIGWWTHDSTDTWENPVPVEAIVTSLASNNGGVVLMHDFDRVHNNEMNEYVISLTKKLIELSERNNLKIVTQSEILGKMEW
ncbi:polysaccharide deacetylase family protein [Sneathiella limimaris]|uniref:polysaccharide deacetylase family protein n=1 Tax=Sneathiella limimaris TaxID=1964213 RepID=UPI00146B78A4|nr:polysaccharide deacetylase family protein [Sneathiella limimaris]